MPDLAEPFPPVSQRPQPVEAGKKEKAVRTKRHTALEDGLEESFRVAHQAILDEIKAGLIDQASSEEEEDEDDQWFTLRWSS